MSLAQRHCGRATASRVPRGTQRPGRIAFTIVAASSGPSPGAWHDTTAPQRAAAARGQRATQACCWRRFLQRIVIIAALDCLRPVPLHAGCRHRLCDRLLFVRAPRTSCMHHSACACTPLARRALHRAYHSGNSLCGLARCLLSALRRHKTCTPPCPPAALLCMPTAPSNGAAPVLNIIPNNGVWPDGVPPVMGAHLMASGTVAPVSTSKGAGDGVAEPMFAYPTGEGDTQVVVYATPKNAAAGLARMVTETAAAAIKAKGSFTLVLSGAQQQCACVCVCVCVCVRSPLSAAQQCVSRKRCSQAESYYIAITNSSSSSTDAACPHFSSFSPSPLAFTDVCALPIMHHLPLHPHQVARLWACYQALQN
jgi:hypothetical protein